MSYVLYAGQAVERKTIWGPHLDWHDNRSIFRDGLQSLEESHTREERVNETLGSFAPKCVAWESQEDQVVGRESLAFLIESRDSHIDKTLMRLLFQPLEF